VLLKPLALTALDPPFEKRVSLSNPPLLRRAWREKDAMSAAQTSTMLKGAGGQDSEQKAPVAETLTLRLVPRRKKKDERVHWSKDVQEINEFSGKFKSKS